MDELDSVSKKMNLGFTGLHGMATDRCIFG